MLEFDALDEYPIHQVPLPMRYVGPSDRHFYDRCIYQGVDHEADVFFITGMGLYPNLGVMDAFATVRRGDRQWAVRMSGSRPDDRLTQQVGPYRIEVIEPFPRCASCAMPTTTASGSISRTRPSTARSPNRSTSAGRATASCSTRPASPASERGAVSSASTARRSR